MITTFARIHTQKAKRCILCCSHQISGGSVHAEGHGLVAVCDTIVASRVGVDEQVAIESPVDAPRVLDDPALALDHAIRAGHATRVGGQEGLVDQAGAPADDVDGMANWRAGIGQANTW
jgi:hypothetical protein